MRPPDEISFRFWPAAAGLAIFAIVRVHSFTAARSSLVVNRVVSLASLTAPAVCLIKRHNLLIGKKDAQIVGSDESAGFALANFQKQQDGSV
jgi:hypothetical protein